MKHQPFHKLLALLCGVLLIGATLLTGCAANPEENHEGHDHTAPTTEQSDTKDEHNHKDPVAIGLTYEQDGETFTLVIKDCKGNVVYTKKGLEKKATLSQPVNDGVTCLSWVGGHNPGDFTCLYIDRLHCRVSDMIAGEQATDGTRILCTEKTDGKLNVVIRDLYDQNGFRQTHVLNDAYLEGEYTVLNAQMVGKDKGRLSYLVNGEGAHRIMEYSLYPDAETTKATEKTEK